jgi:hypothetical protein
LTVQHPPSEVPHTQMRADEVSDRTGAGVDLRVRPGKSLIQQKLPRTALWMHR